MASLVVLRGKLATHPAVGIWIVCVRAGTRPRQALEVVLVDGVTPVHGGLVIVVVVDAEELFVQVGILDLAGAGPDDVPLEAASQRGPLVVACRRCGGLVVAPPALGHAGAGLLMFRGVQQGRTEGVHFRRRVRVTAPWRLRFGGGRRTIIHIVGVGVVDPAHAAALRHPLPAPPGEDETAPAGAPEDQNPAHDRQRDGEGQLPAVQTRPGRRVTRGRGGAGDQRLVEDGGGVGEEGAAGDGGFPAGDVQGLQDYTVSVKWTEATIQHSVCTYAPLEVNGLDVQFARNSCCGMKL